MQFGKINHFILFGGDAGLVNFMTAAKGYSMTIVSAPRVLDRLLTNGQPLRAYLQQKGIDYIEVEDLTRFDVDQYCTESTMGISFGAPWIFSENFIKKFQGRLLNNHGMKLPENRGGGGYSWQILRGRREGCYLLHLVDAGVDTGNLVFFKEFLYPESCRIPQDYHDYFDKGLPDFFNAFLAKLESNFDFSEVVQDESKSIYWPRLFTPEHGFIDWHWKTQEIERFICAFDRPYPGASTFVKGKRVHLRGARGDSGDGTFHPFMSGLVYRKTRDRLSVAVPDGTITIEGVYDQDGADIMGKIKLGDRFVTPVEHLDASLSFRAVYDGKGLKTNIKWVQTP